MKLDEFRQLPEDELRKILMQFSDEVVEEVCKNMYIVLNSFHKHEIEQGQSFGKGPMFQFINMIVREFIKKL